MSAIEEAKKQKNFKNARMRFSIRVNYIFFPFHTVELIDTLLKSGYAPTTPPPPPAPPRGVRFSITGTIARKGEVIIDVNDDRGVLSASASSPKTAIDGLDEVLGLIKTNFKVDLGEMASFYELIGHIEVETDQNPIEKIGHIMKENRFIREFGQILGEDVSLFTLRLSPIGKVPNQTEWFDITIEPDVIKTSIYNIEAVCRSNDKSKVQKFTEELIPKISKIIDAIESA
jgi:hypothetical protein